MSVPIRDVEFPEIMNDSFTRYMKYVIEDRALPDPRDGLKPVHRRSLYGMHENGLYDGKKIKSARSVGDIMGKYHPHGDQSIYDTVVRLSQDFKMRYPLINFMGNNGSIDGDPAGAMRYTESGLSKFGEMLLGEMMASKNAVEFTPNYDEEELEPTVLAGIFPNMLANGTSGIAVGIASQIPSHNLADIIERIVMFLKNPKITNRELSDGLAPDLPTGGKIKGDFEKMYAHGKGKYEIFSSIDEEPFVVDGKSYVRITEIPYGVVKSSIVEVIDDMIQEGKKIKQKNKEADPDDFPQLMLLDVKSLSDTEIVVEYADGCFDKVVSMLNQPKKSNWTAIYAYGNFNVVHDDKPVVMGLKRLIEVYVEHQCQVSVNLAKSEYESVLKRIHILEGLQKALGMIDAIVQIVRDSDDADEAVAKLVSNFGFSQTQAEYIVDMRLSQLTRLNGKKIDNELDAKNGRARELEQFLGDKRLVIKKLTNDLLNLRSLSDERRTQVI